MRGSVCVCVCVCVRERESHHCPLSAHQPARCHHHSATGQIQGEGWCVCLNLTESSRWCQLDAIGLQHASHQDSGIAQYGMKSSW